MRLQIHISTSNVIKVRSIFCLERNLDIFLNPHSSPKTILEKAFYTFLSSTC